MSYLKKNCTTLKIYGPRKETNFLNLQNYEFLSPWTDIPWIFLEPLKKEFFPLICKNNLVIFFSIYIGVNLYWTELITYFCLKTGVADKSVCAKCSHQLGSSLPCLILLTRLIYYYVTANCLLRGWGRCLKVTMQTRAPKNFHWRRWGTSGVSSVCGHGSEAPIGVSGFFFGMQLLKNSNIILWRKYCI